MGDTLMAVAAVVVSLVVMARVGSRIAQRLGYSPVLGAVVGGALPVIGVGILLLLEQRKGSNHFHPHGG